MTLVDQLLQHALSMRFGDLPKSTVRAAITFITDSVAVGLAGSRHPRVPELRAAAAHWGQGNDSHEWLTGQEHSAPTAAMLNAYQIHNQEFDCVHEAAVVHPMATVLPALVAHAERLEAAGQAVSGAVLIEALVLAVDVAATLGSAQIAPMRFFRPAMCGALGAALGLAKLNGCHRGQMADTLGIAYSQLAGTMQAHLEGSPMLALQVGMAARAAVMSLDLALAGFSGPRDVVDGPFGYFNLFDAPLAPRLEQVQAEFNKLGRLWRIEEVSHKPFPTGRAAHGALDGLASLMALHGLQGSDVTSMVLAAPPLILRLVGRPARADMDVNYARLCLPYLAASYLLNQRITLDDFSPAALADPQRHALATRLRLVPNACTDPNALAPQSLSLGTRDGQHLHIDLPAVLGHPLRPLPGPAQRAKFDACCTHAGLPADAAERLHGACQALDGATSLAPWLRLMRL